MIGKVILCDSCKKSTEDPTKAGWVFVAMNGVTKPFIGGTNPDLEFRVSKPLDFCTWRCFRKYWKGK